MRQAGEAVEYGEMGRGVEQRLMLVLAVELNQT